MSTQSDARPFPTGDRGENPKDKKSSSNEQTMTGNVGGGGAGGNTNKSTPFQTNQSRTININMGSSGSGRVNSTNHGPTKYVKSTFNITGSKIVNASIGNEGPTEFNTQISNYQGGSKKQDFNISGGKFVQSTIGGDAQYHNDASQLNAGNVGGASGVNQSAGFIDIDKREPPFTPEEYLAKLLKSDITSTELVELLERKYSIVELAYIIPSAKRRRMKMVEALLQVADGDENEVEMS